jgi:hypothetical protein
MSAFVSYLTIGELLQHGLQLPAGGNGGDRFYLGRLGRLIDSKRLKQALMDLANQYGVNC